MLPYKQLALLVLMVGIGSVVYMRYAPMTLQPTLPVPVAVATTTVPTATVSVTPVVAQLTNAMLVVDGRTYPVAVGAQETLVEVMHSLVATGELAFTGREYPGLGFFVESIHGKKNEGDRYWVFYVNGVSATEGASSLVFKPGDRIEWKYKKSY